MSAKKEKGINGGNIRKYDDIIHLPHHVSSVHPQMPIEDRAAQFSPFAALTGHGEAIKETARQTEKRIELDENQKLILDGKMKIVKERLAEAPVITVTYFLPDAKKAGGIYLTITDAVKKIDEYRKLIVMEGGMRIPVREIVRIELAKGK